MGEPLEHWPWAAALFAPLPPQDEGEDHPGGAGRPPDPDREGQQHDEGVDRDSSERNSLRSTTFRSIFTSVLNKQRIFDVLQTAIRVYQSRKRRIPTSELNDYMLPLIENYPPPATKGKYIKIKYVTQLPTPTPQFAFFVNLPQYIKEPYRRFLENNMRDHWDFSGVPVQIYFRQK